MTASSDRPPRCRPVGKIDRAKLYGVKMDQNTCAKVKDGDRFFNFSWWLGITPAMRSTVFSRMDLHFWVAFYVLSGNFVYFLIRRKSFDLENLQMTEEAEPMSSMDEVSKFFMRLLTWTLSGYMMMVIRIYFMDVRTKAGNLLRSLSRVMSLLVMILDFDATGYGDTTKDNEGNEQKERTKLLSEEIHSALTAIGKYAFYEAAKSTSSSTTTLQTTMRKQQQMRQKQQQKQNGVRIDNDDCDGKRHRHQQQQEQLQHPLDDQQIIHELFTQRGYDPNHLLARHKKETISLLKLGILTSIKEEVKQLKIPGGCCAIDEYWFDETMRNDLINAIEAFCGAAMTVSSCVSGTKIPYCYNQLQQFTTRLFLFFQVYSYFRKFGIKHEEGEHTMPFTCFTLDYQPYDKVQCTTYSYLLLNISLILICYYILGVLIMYPKLLRAWDDQLVIKSYINVIDEICMPLVPLFTTSADINANTTIYNDDDHDQQRFRATPLRELRRRYAHRNPARKSSYTLPTTTTTTTVSNASTLDITSKASRLSYQDETSVMHKY